MSHFRTQQIWMQKQWISSSICVCCTHIWSRITLHKLFLTQPINAYVLESCHLSPDEINNADVDGEEAKNIPGKYHNGSLGNYAISMKINTKVSAINFLVLLFAN